MEKSRGRVVYEVLNSQNQVLYKGTSEEIMAKYDYDEYKFRKIVSFTKQGKYSGKYKINRTDDIKDVGSLKTTKCIYSSGDKISYHTKLVMNGIHGLEKSINEDLVRVGLSTPTINRIMEKIQKIIVYSHQLTINSNDNEE